MCEERVQDSEELHKAEIIKLKVNPPPPSSIAKDYMSVMCKRNGDARIDYVPHVNRFLTNEGTNIFVKMSPCCNVPTGKGDSHLRTNLIVFIKTVFTFGFLECKLLKTNKYFTSLYTKL
jgi:hypothetical protein